MNNLQNLKIWQLSFDLAIDVFAIAKTFPKEEKYEMASQIRRCSSSIPANIAEGAGRNSDKEFLHFYLLQMVLVLNLKLLFYSRTKLNTSTKKQKHQY